MTYNILIVDDSLTVRMDLGDAFRAAGFRPLLCATIAEARSRLATSVVDAVVLDVLLPDGNGVDLLNEIRSAPDGAAMLVVMLSSEAEVKDRIRGLRTGADEYVGKPYDAGYLVAKVEERVRSRQSGGVTTILVIDDSPTFRDVLRSALTAAGYVVFVAGSGEDGLRLAGSRRPDAMIVDGMLPGMDGASVIGHVRLDAALRDVPCLLLTGSEGAQIELRALDAGADAFVRKEEDLEVILARLAAMLRGAPLRPHTADETRSLAGLRRILAVDDSPSYLNGLAEVLRGEGYDVILARSGEEALELLAVQRVDCILLDLMMPGLSGQETCERIKAAPTVRDIPLVILTARDDREAMIQGLGAGADDYIPKSSEFEVLKARVRAQIRRRQFEDEHRRIREELLQKELEAAEARAARQLAETKAVLVEELERKNRELEAFTYSVSHDLRAPLRAIDGFSRILLDDFAETLHPTAREHLQRVGGAAQRMSELIDDLLQLSRVSGTELRRRPTNLTAIARDVAAELGRQSARVVEFSADDDLLVDADHRLMRIVLENLLGNSWKFTAKTTAPRVHVGVRHQDGESTYFVCDNGAGFDVAYAARLFRPFQRLHSEQEFAGSGIGLATVQRIVERHGGRVWAEAEPGRGATFYFTVAAPRHGSRTATASAENA